MGKNIKESNKVKEEANKNIDEDNIKKEPNENIGKNAKIKEESMFVSSRLNAKKS